jgi:ABC-2 type transport system permease protein
MRRTMAIMRKEFIHIIRDPRTLSIVVLMPLLMLLILGYAINVDVRDISTIVYDQSRSAESRRFLDRFWQTNYFEVTRYAGNAEEITAGIDAGDAKVGIVIPPDFGARLAGNQPASVQLFIDASDPNVAQTAIFAAQAIGQQAAVEIISQQLGAASGQSLQMPIDLRTRLLYNPDLKSINFMIPGLLGAILQTQALMLTAFAIVREREQGTMEQLIVTPIRPWELMLGKILPFAVLSFLNAVLTLALGSFWFHVDVKGDLGLLLLLSLVFLLSCLGLGILISTVSRNQIQAVNLAMFIMLPAFILSGFMIPRDNMPTVAYYSGFFLPITYFLVILRTIVMKGVGIGALWDQVIPLTVFSLGVFGISVAAFRKRLE